MTSHCQLHYLITLAFLLPLFTSGCGSGPGTVSGIVRFQGKPLPGGMVSFLAADGQARQGTIDPDGSYNIGQVPAGPAKILVVTIDRPKFVNKAIHFPGEANSHSKDSQGEHPLGPYVKIPERYSRADQTDLNLEVRTGEQTFDIDLQP